MKWILSILYAHLNIKYFKTKMFVTQDDVILFMYNRLFLLRKIVFELSNWRSFFYILTPMGWLRPGFLV